MIIQHNCVVKEIYKNPTTEQYTVVTVRIRDKGKTTYVGFSKRPKIREGQALCKGEEI